VTTVGNWHPAARGKSLEIYFTRWDLGQPTKLFPATWLKPTRKIHAILYITGFNRKAFSSWTRLRECTSMRFFSVRSGFEGSCRSWAQEGRSYALERSGMNVDSMRSRAYSRDILLAFRSKRKAKSNVKRVARAYPQKSFAAWKPL